MILTRTRKYDPDLAKLIADYGHLSPDQLWTPDLVRSRLVEAVRVVQITAGTPYPRQYVVNWPEYELNWADLLGRVEGGTIYDRDARPRLSASRREVTRMLRTIDWQAKYLQTQPGPARVLAAWLACKATRRKFARICKRNGWPRATAYRAIDKALATIARGLIQDGVSTDG